MSDEYDDTPEVIAAAQRIMADALTEFEDYPDALRNVCMRLAQERENVAQGCKNVEYWKAIAEGNRKAEN